MTSLTRRLSLLTLISTAIAAFSNLSITNAQNEKPPPKNIPGRIAGPSDEVTAICIAGRDLRNQGKFDAALAEFDKALQKARFTQDHSGEAWSLSNIATVYRYRAQNEPKKAAEFLKTAADQYSQAANIARKNSDKFNEAYATLYLGALAAMRKDTAEAERHYAIALPLFRAVNDRYYLGRTYAYQARAALLRSEPKQAIELFEKALPLLVEVRVFDEATQVTEELKAAKAAVEACSG